MENEWMSGACMLLSVYTLNSGFIFSTCCFIVCSERDVFFWLHPVSAPNFPSFWDQRWRSELNIPSTTDLWATFIIPVHFSSNKMIDETKTKRKNRILTAATFLQPDKLLLFGKTADCAVRIQQSFLTYVKHVKPCLMARLYRVNQEEWVQIH